MHRFRSGVVSVGLLIVFFVSLSGGCGPGKGREAVVSLAVQTPLTGPRSVLGRTLLNGVVMAVEQARPRLAGNGIRLVVRVFDEGDRLQGIANAHLLLTDQTVVGVVGHLDSDVAITASEIYAQKGLPVVSPAVTTPEYSDRGLKTVFRLLPPDGVQGEVAARFAVKALNAGKVFIVHDRSMYGQALADAFKEAAGEDVTVAAYRPSAFRPSVDLVHEIVDSGADLLFFAGNEETAATLLHLLRAAGSRIIFMGGDSLDTPTFAHLAGPVAEGVYFTSPGRDPLETARGSAWAAGYRERFQERPLPLAALGYDAATVLLRAVEEVSRTGIVPTPDLITRALSATRELKGVSGGISFDEKGDNRLAGAGSYRVLRHEGAGYPGVAVPQVPPAVTDAEAAGDDPVPPAQSLPVLLQLLLQ